MGCMKKLISLLLTLLVLLTLSACGGEAASSLVSEPASSVSQEQSADFVKPQNYASVLLVTINPQFRLYLDDAGTVLAVEPVNDDAKSMKDSISFENKKYETVVKELVVAASDKGFVKEDATINFEMTESKVDAVQVAEILDKVTQSANQAATQLAITVTVKAEDKTESVSSSQAASEEVSSAHTHEFAAATCTEPKTCTCGQTEGKKLGHDYKNGVCSRCNAKDPAASYTSVKEKKGIWSLEYAADNHYYDADLTLNTFDGELGVSYDIGDALSAMSEEMREELKPDSIQFKGEYYYIGRGNGDGFDSVTEEGSTVTVTDSSGNKLVLTRTAENKLKVKNAPAEFGGMSKIPVGTILTFQAK